LLFYAIYIFNYVICQPHLWHILSR